MIIFVVVAGLLAAAVLAYVLRPLISREGKDRVSRRAANIAIYKDELRELDTDLAAGTLAREDYDKAKLELEARLLEDASAGDAAVAPMRAKRRLVAIGAAVPLLAIAVYLVTGNPLAMSPARQLPDAAQIEAMVDRLAAKMREHPEDADGWKLLGRSYTVMGRYQDAVAAYAKAAERSPRDAQLLADFADALAMARGQTLQGEPEKIVERALAIDPKNLKALALAGTAAYERKDYASAAETWSRMLPLVPPGSEDAQAIQQNVEEARKLAGIGEPAASRDDTASGPPPDPTPIIATVSPTPGSSVASYLTKASFNLRHFGEISNGRSTYAVVDLRSFQTPTQARALFGAVEVVRAYVRVRAGKLPMPVRSVPVTSAALIPPGMRTAATVAAATAKSYGVLLAGLHPKTAADRKVKQRYVQMRQAALVEAAALQRPLQCACVFAAIVRADSARLSTLAAEPEIRAVDPGPPNVELTGLTALPLDPRVTRVVPGTGLPSG